MFLDRVAGSNIAAGEPWNIHASLHGVLLWMSHRILQSLKKNETRQTLNAKQPCAMSDIENSQHISIASCVSAENVPILKAEFRKPCVTTFQLDRLAAFRPYLRLMEFILCCILQRTFHEFRHTAEIALHALPEYSCNRRQS